MIILIWLILGGLLGYISYGMARRRNREGALWGILGFMFGLIPIVVLLIIGESKNQFSSASQANPADNQGNRLDELVKLKALLDQGAITQEEFDTAKRKFLS